MRCKWRQGDRGVNCTRGVDCEIHQCMDIADKLSGTHLCMHLRDRSDKRRAIDLLCCMSKSCRQTCRMSEEGDKRIARRLISWIQALCRESPTHSSLLSLNHLDHPPAALHRHGAAVLLHSLLFPAAPNRPTRQSRLLNPDRVQS